MSTEEAFFNEFSSYQEQDRFSLIAVGLSLSITVISHIYIFESLQWFIL